MTQRFDGLPGHALVHQGLADLEAGRWTSEALLLAIAPTRLASAGVRLPEMLVRERPPDPEHRLYFSLDGELDPYRRYNAMKRELDSFMSALEREQRLRAE